MRKPIRELPYAILICSLALWPGSQAAAQSPGAGTARAQLERFSAGLQSLHAHFQQQVIGKDDEVQDQSTGEVWLQRPNLFRWEYGGDFPQLVVADGTTVWIYDEVLEQVTAKNQSQAEGDSPLTLLTDPERLEDQFEVTEIGSTDEADLLELRPRDADSQFERVLLGLRSDTLVMMVMEDAFGLMTEIHFSDVERNPAVDPGLFRFQPPESADVIGDVPGTE